MQTLEKQLHHDISRIMGEDGLLVADGFSHDHKQFDYALRVASGFCLYDDAAQRTALNMLEAATGTGKTLGYLIPLFCYAARTGERVMVSTYTRLLQKQILEKDAKHALKWVEQVTGISLSIARRIGMANYVSPVGCARLIDNLKQEGETTHEDAINLLENLMDWTEDTCGQGLYTNSGILDDFLAEEGYEALPAAIPQGWITLSARSPEDEKERYLSDVARAKLVDIQIVNHALLMMHAYRWASILDNQDERRTSVLVCDEADRLQDAAETVMRADLTLHHINQIAQQTAQALGASDLLNPVQDLHDLIRHSVTIPERNVLAITHNSPHSEAIQRAVILADTTARAVAKKIEGRHNDLLIEDKDKPLLFEFVDAANDLSEFATAMNAADNTAVLSWSPVRAYPSLRIGCPNPGRLLSRLWVKRDGRNGANDQALPPIQPLKAALFTSATLGVPGKTLPSAFDEFASSIGVIRHPAKGSDTPIHNVLTQLYARFEPAKFGKMHFVLADPRAANPTRSTINEDKERQVDTNPEWLDYAAKMILRAYQEGGPVLCLTLSYKDTSNLAERLQGSIPEHDLIVHQKGLGLASVVQAFRNHSYSTPVLISPCAWEGVDIKGYIKHLVITRIPFQPLDSSESEILRAHLYSKGMAEDKITSVLQSRAVSAARRKLAQGIGRPIRSKVDEATIWIADPRFPLPSQMTNSLDPIFLEAPPRHIQQQMRSCIPSRFMDEFEGNSNLCLLDGSLYQPIL